MGLGVLVASMARGQEPGPAPPPRHVFEGYRPLKDAIEEWATDELDLRACYEEAPHENGWARLDVSSVIGVEPLAAAVELSNASAYPVRFRLAHLGARELVLGDVVLDGGSGAWVPGTLLLDTRITLPPGNRTIAAAVVEWRDLLQSATGNSIALHNAGFGQGLTDAWGADRSARDILADILDDQNTNIVWSVAWSQERSFWAVSFRTPWRLVEAQRPPESGVPVPVEMDSVRVYPDGTRVYNVPHSAPP